MLKIRISRLLMLFVVLLAACGSGELATPTDRPASTGQPPTVILPTVTISSPTLAAAMETALPTQAFAATPLPIATSRGPNLEATDPLTVSLASGSLQFVEFFRFT